MTTQTNNALNKKSATGLKVAISQTPGCLGDPKAALGIMSSEAARAQAEGADILLLPELFLTGYNLGKTLARTLAGEVAGEMLNAAREIARAHAVALVFGYPELVGDKVANAAMFVSAAGETLLNYRKVHLYGELDRQMFEVRGDTFPVIAYRGWQIGLMICYDTEFPEPARLLALQRRRMHPGANGVDEALWRRTSCGRPRARLRKPALYRLCQPQRGRGRRGLYRPLMHLRPRWRSSGLGRNGRRLHFSGVREGPHFSH